MNPMLGHRGCRLGIVYPEITRMQARAILEAACIVKKDGVEVKPEIMIPLVGHVNELKDQEKVVREAAKDVFAKAGITVDYLVGTMIELPRAALTADEIATVAEFFSYGTNDLTQTTFGLSRDDAGKFLPDYVRREILPADPFEKIDQARRRQAREDGRRARPHDPAEAEDRHLRRARRRADVGGVLPPDEPRLRQLLAVPDPDRASRRRPGGRPRGGEGLRQAREGGAKAAPEGGPEGRGEAGPKAKASTEKAKAVAKAKARRRGRQGRPEGEGRRRRSPSRSLRRRSRPRRRS